MNKQFNLLSVVLLFVISSYCFGQTKPNWKPVADTHSAKIYININDLKSHSGQDIFVWVLEEHKTPLVIESVKGKIYSTRTLYLFNPKKEKYSFLEVIYFDQKKNKIKSFSYKRPANLDTFKYSYPLMANSDAEKIMKACLAEINKED